jgi:hypothetical protein
MVEKYETNCKCLTVRLAFLYHELEIVHDILIIGKIKVYMGSILF